MAKRHRQPIPAWVVTDPDLRDALEEFTVDFGHQPVIDAIAPTLTCHEIEIIAAVIATAGAPDTARRWLAHPTHAGQPDDEHFGLTADKVQIPQARWIALPPEQRHDSHNIRPLSRVLGRRWRKNRP